MRERRHALRPFLECCESRALLSGGLISATAAPLVETQPIMLIVPLDGTFRGRYHQHNANPDVGSTFDFTGSGHVNKVGHTFVTGHIQSIGLIATGQAHGTLFLAGVHGTITLSLTGPVQHNGPKGLPDYFTFTIVGGTGKYTNATDTGTASLVTIPGHSTSHPNAGGHGTFTLVLTSGPIPVT